MFYGISLISLIGLLFFGQKISGATSWYSFGGFSFQPSEFAKVTTALLIATNLSSIQTDIKRVKDGEGLINFGKNNLKSKIINLNLSKNGNLKEASRNLFHFLHFRRYQIHELNFCQ